METYQGQPHPFVQGNSIAPRCATCGAGPDNAIHTDRREGAERREPPVFEELKHEYPSSYKPGQGVWFVDEAWRVLDSLPPGVLSVERRAYLAGLIGGALVKAVQERGRLDLEGGLRKGPMAGREGAGEASPAPALGRDLQGGEQS